MHPMKQEIGVWHATREWVRAVGKGLLACVVVVYNLCLIIRCIEETGVALPGHHVG
jgi:hypothetical protein